MLSAYIKKCKEIAKKVKSGEISQTTRNYLKTMGIIRDREVIKDYDRLMSELRNKVDDASKLISYLTPKALEELPADPFIDNAERIYEELKTWSTGVKNNPSKPLRLAHLNTEDLSLNLKEFATVAKRQTANKTNKDVKNQPVQMSIYDDENQNV